MPPTNALILEVVFGMTVVYNIPFIWGKFYACGVHPCEKDVVYNNYIKILFPYMIHLVLKHHPLHEYGLIGHKLIASLCQYNTFA